VIDDGATVRTRGGQPLEAVITEGLAHAGVVGTLAHCVLPPRGRLHDSAASSGPAGSPRGAKPKRAPALAAAAEEGGAAAAAAAKAPAPAGEGRGLAGQAWLLLEYCDKGCLQARRPRPPRRPASGPAAGRARARALRPSAQRAARARSASRCVALVLACAGVPGRPRRLAHGGRGRLPARPETGE